jgi:hypothetical protein
MRSLHCVYDGGATKIMSLQVFFCNASYLKYDDGWVILGGTSADKSKYTARLKH